MDSCCIDIDLNRLKPVSCTPAFARLLGFRREQTCLKSFRRVTHFKGHNFNQLATLKNPRAVVVVDRSFNPVGTISTVNVDPGTHQMRINVDDGQSRLLTRGYLAPVTISFDESFRIQSIREDNGGLLHPDLKGKVFPDAIAPPGLITRLSTIYRQRLTQHGRVHLTHVTRTTRSDLDPVNWFVKHQSDHSFLAELHAPSEVSSEQNIVIQPLRNRITIGDYWAARLGINQQIEREGLSCYQASVLEEDRALVNKMLTSARLPPQHSFCYRLADTAGKVINVRHRLKRRNPDSLQRIIDGTIEALPDGHLTEVHLQTLGILHDLPAIGNQCLHLRDDSAITTIIRELGMCVAEEGLQTSLALASSDHPDACSMCGLEPGSGPGLVISLPGYRPGTGELRQLIERDYSLTQAGKPSAWKSVFDTVHRLGYHAVVGLDRHGCLSICLTSEAAEHD